MEDIAAWLAKWSGRAPPAINRPLVAIFAGNHGVARRGISPRPVEATQRAVELCAAGGAAINQVCLAYDLGLKVFDLALHLPTGDITHRRGARRTRLRRDHGLRHGGDCRRHRSHLPWRSRRRQFDGSGGDLLHALRRQGRRLGRAGFRRGRGDDAPQGRGGGCRRRPARQPREGPARSAAPRRRA